VKGFLGVDLGTSAAKALLLTEASRVVAKGSARYPTRSGSHGEVEQSPDDWWDAVVRATRACLAEVPADIVVSGMGFSGHMSVLLPLGSDLRPLRAALTVGDTRGAEEAQRLNEAHGSLLAASSGNLALAAFTLAKLLWYRTHEPASFERTRVIVGAKDFLRLRATGSLATEPTDAGNTLLLDLATRTWNTGLMETLAVAPNLLPPLRESLEVAGDLTPEAADAFGLPAGLPVITGLADMAASVLGAGMLSGERIAVTLGTSGQVTQVVDAPRPALLGRFTYHPHALPGRAYVMATLFTGGLGLRWFADVVASISGGSTEDAMARVLASAAQGEPGARGVTFLPYLTGSGSPRFDPGRRAGIHGLGRGHTGADLSRAVLEGVAFSVRHALEELERHHPGGVSWVAGGGGMRSALWRQITADAIQRPLGPLLEEDAGPLGTAIAVGHALGAFVDLEAGLGEIVRIGPTSEPSHEARPAYDAAYRRYLTLVGDGVGDQSTRSTSCSTVSTD
jgi:xylulokinase